MFDIRMSTLHIFQEIKRWTLSLNEPEAVKITLSNKGKGEVVLAETNPPVLKTHKYGIFY